MSADQFVPPVELNLGGRVLAGGDPAGLHRQGRMPRTGTANSLECSVVPGKVMVEDHRPVAAPAVPAAVNPNVAIMALPPRQRKLRVIRLYMAPPALEHWLIPGLLCGALWPGLSVAWW